MKLFLVRGQLDRPTAQSAVNLSPAMITQDTINKIFDTARIEEVIGDFINLKKAGSNYKGLSPFANEKTPSFMVSPSKQIFKDFSSGKGGSVVTFLMEHEQYSYPEALRYLAKKYNIEIEETAQSEEEKAKRSERESLFLVNEYANRHFQEQLWQDEKGRQIGLSYFRERDFSEEIIREFQLGYSQEGYQAFTDQALRDGYQLDILDKVGLTKVDGERKTDRFRGRVMFPILSHTGRVLGFGGRSLIKDAKVAKYLNSPESEIYHKSKILYGIFQAKSHLARQDECFLVEGYTDVISLHQAGVKNVVASSGTALTEGQVLLIKRFTQNITLLYDGDPAGIKASLRGIDLILAQGLEVSVVLFPEGEDPDSYARSVSSVELRDFLKEEKVNFLRFKSRLLLAESGDNPLARAKAAREMVQSIALIPNALERSAYIQESAQILGIEERILYSELGQVESSLQKKAEQKSARPQPADAPAEMAVVEKSESSPLQEALYEQEKALCWLLLNHGDKRYLFDEELEDQAENYESVAEYLMTELEGDEIHFKNPLYRAIYLQFLETYNREQRVLAAEELLRGGAKELMHLVVDLIADEPALHDWRRKNIFPPERDAYIQRFCQEALLRYKEKTIGAIIEEMAQKSRQGESLGKEEIQSIKQLTQLRVQINQKLNRIL